jgi:protein ImuB
MDTITQRRIACLILKKSDREITRTETLKVAQAALRFTPQIAIRGGNTLFFELTRSKLLYSEQGFRHRMSVLLRRMGLEGTLALGTHPCEALARAHYGEKKALPLQALHFFGNPFYQDPLFHSKVERLLDHFQVLGIDTLESFFKIPTESLVLRFGEDAALLSAHLNQKLEPAWPILSFPKKVEESTDLGFGDFEGSQFGLEPLLFSIRGLLDKALVRLRAQSLRASRVLIELDLARYSFFKVHQRRFFIDLCIPQGSVAGLMPLIREKLSHEFGIAPLHAPPQKLRIEILETQPGRGAQRDFFNRKEDEQEALDALLGRLAHELGEAQIFKAKLSNRYLPEKAWEKTHPTEATPHTPPKGFSPKGRVRDFLNRAWTRPSRLLQIPERLLRQGPALLSSSGRAWIIQNLEGPERLSGEWWAESAFDRDYYKVLTHTGEKLWVFLDRAQPSSGPTGQLYLQGYFD